MEPTRIDSTKLKTAVARAEKKVDEALAELALLVVMIDVDRASVPRTLDGFVPAARQFAQVNEAPSRRWSRPSTTTETRCSRISTTPTC